jgi:hypothetical protein
MKVKRINQIIEKKKGAKGCKIKNYMAYLCIGFSPMIQ